MLDFNDKLDVVQPSDFTVILNNMAQKLFYIEFRDRYGRGCYICSYDGVQRINNVVEDDAVRLIFENYSFSTSPKEGLRYRSLQRIPDFDFTDGYRDEWTTGITPIYIVESGTMDADEIEANFGSPVEFYKGEPFRYEDFTQEQIAQLQLPATVAAEAAAEVTREAQTVIHDAQAITRDARDAAGNANQQAVLARKAADNANKKAEVAEAAADNADRKAGVAQTAADNADNKALFAQKNGELAAEQVAQARDLIGRLTPFEERINEVETKVDNLGTIAINCNVIDATFDVIVDGVTTTYTWQGRTINHRAVFGSRYTIAAKGIVGYVTPDDVTGVKDLFDVVTLDYAPGKWYGIEWDVTLPSPLCTRIASQGDMSLHASLPIQSRMRGCLLDDNGKVLEYLTPDNWRAHTLDGSMGQVMVEIPTHYRRFETAGSIRRCKISDNPIFGYHAVPMSYISAYEAAIERSTSKLCSVVNAGVDYRGGNNTSEWDETYRSLLGRPVTNLNRSNLRMYARKRNNAATSEWNCLVYEQYKSVVWLYMVEYANRNSQASFTAEKDYNGYMQGGLGNGATTLSDGILLRYNTYNPFIPCGHTDALGNISGEVTYTMPSADGSTYATVYVNRYRGIENIFGHIIKNSDGINIEVKADADGGTSKVYVTDDTTKFNDINYAGYRSRGDLPRASGYVKQIIFDGFGDIVPSEINGSSTTYYCDYYNTSVNTFLGGVFFGGCAIDGVKCGLWTAYIFNILGRRSSIDGTRLSFIPLKNI